MRILFPLRRRRGGIPDVVDIVFERSPVGFEMGIPLLPFVPAGVAVEDVERVRPVAVFVRVFGRIYRNAFDDGDQTHLRSRVYRFGRRSFPEFVHDKFARRSA